MRWSVRWLPKPRQKLHKVARAGVAIQLGLDQTAPSGLYRIERARKHKHNRAVGDPGETSTLQGAGSNGFERQHSEQLTKSVDRFIEQWLHRFGCTVAAGQSGAAAGEHHIHSVVGDPMADVGSDSIPVIRADAPVRQTVARLLQELLQTVAAGVIGKRSSI